MIKIDNVTKNYHTYEGTIRALEDISMELYEGELVAIVGKSGSGKTTLLNLIAGLILPDMGTVTFNGEIVSNKKQLEILKYRKKHIGIIMQDYCLLNDRSIFENVELPLRIRHVSKTDRKVLVHKYLCQVDLLNKKNDYPSQLSGGQQQRASIARALIYDPDVILADEPTGALDEENADKIVKILREIANKGKTVIMVTHQLKYLSVCDHYYWLDEGKLRL